jgi:hypothetical protein
MVVIVRRSRTPRASAQFVLGFATDGGSVAAWVGVFGGSVGTGSFADSLVSSVSEVKSESGDV